LLVLVVRGCSNSGGAGTADVADATGSSGASGDEAGQPESSETGSGAADQSKAATPETAPEAGAEAAVAAAEVNGNQLEAPPAVQAPSSSENHPPAGDGNSEVETEKAESVEGLLPSAESASEAPSPKSGVTIGNFSSPGVAFFGTRGTGNDIAFVLDHSSSMAMGHGLATIGNLDRVKKELMRAIHRLEPEQTFSVVVFNHVASSDPRFMNASPTAKHRRELSEWLDRIYAEGGTDPLPGMRLVLPKKYDVIFLLSDGEFDADAVAAIRGENVHETVIHTISVSQDSHTLRQIATDAGGQFVFVQ
jgi:hypothetical protein